MLINTASQISLIGKDLVPSNSKIIRQETKIKGVTQNSLTIKEIAIIKFEIGGRKFIHPFRVIENFTDRPLLGNDFLTPQCATIDYGTKTLTLRRYGKPPRVNFCRQTASLLEVSANVFQNISQCYQPVYVLERRTYFPPRSQIYVPVKLVNSRTGDEYILEPNYDIQNKTGLLIPRTLLSANQNLVPMINPLDRKIILGKNSVIGSAEGYVEMEEKKCMTTLEESQERGMENDAFTISEADRKLFDKSKLKINPNLSDKQKEEIAQLCFKYASAFAWTPEQIGRAKHYVHHIDLTTQVPFSKPQYQIPAAVKPHIEDQINLLLTQGIIEPSSSAYNNPVLLIRKPVSGEFRFLLDARTLNLHAKFQVCSLTPIQEILNKMGGKLYYSVLDIKSAFFNIPLAEESRDCTSFSIPSIGSFRYTVIPQGLHSSPAALNRVVSMALANLDPAHVSFYMDDIFLYSDNFSKTLELLEQLFIRLIDAGLRLSPEKCFMCWNEVIALGHHVSKFGYKISDKITKAIETYKKPTSVKQVRSFLGLCNYVRKYIPSYAELSEPLQQLIRKNQKFRWNEEQEVAFEKLKRVLMEAPVLRPYDEKKELRVYTDASTKAVSAILMQCEDNNPNDWYPIAYYSWLLRHSEKNLDIFSLELLAVLSAFKAFKYYLMGRSFVLVCDNRALTYIRTAPNLPSKLVRWALALEEFNFSILHCKSEKNISDPLSRETENQPTNEDFDISELHTFITFEQGIDVGEEQRKDKFFGEIWKILIDDPNSKPEYRRQAFYYEIKDDKLYRKQKNANGYKRLLCIPKSLQNFVFDQLHRSKFGGGHYSFTKCLKMALCRVYFPYMRKYFAEKTRQCITCQTHKKLHAPVPFSLQTYPQYGPMEVLSIDESGPYVSSGSSRHRYICTAVCLGTRFLIADSIPDVSAESIAQFLYEKVFLKYGFPKQIILDRLSSHKSRVFQELNEKLGIQLNFANSYAHYTVGLAERYHGLIQSTLKNYINKAHSNWCELLQPVVFTINANIHEGMRYSPFYLLHGFEPRTVMEAALDTACEHPENEIRIQNLCKARDLAYENLQKRFQTQLRYFNKHHRNVQYKPGDFVLIYDPTQKKQHSRCFSGSYHIKGIILEKENDNSYKVEYETRKGQTAVDTFDVRRLRPFVEDTETE